MLAQLCRVMGAIPWGKTRLIASLIRAIQQESMNDNDMIIQYIISTIQVLKHGITILIDALDESSQPLDFVKALCRIFRGALA